MQLYPLKNQVILTSPSAQLALNKICKYSLVDCNNISDSSFQIKNEATRMCMDWRKFNVLSLFRCQENRNSQVTLNVGWIGAIDTVWGLVSFDSSSKCFLLVNVLSNAVEYSLGLRAL